MGEDITKATQEMNTNVTALTQDVGLLKTNAFAVSKLAQDYTGFKSELQTTLEKIINITNQLDTANSKTQSDVQKKLVAYQNLLGDYKKKINDLKKGDFATLDAEINKIKSILTEEDSIRIKRNDLLQKAKTLIDKSKGSSTPPPSPSPSVSASTTPVNANSSTDAVSMLKESQAAIKISQQSKLNPAAPGFASTPSQSKLNPATPGFKPKTGGSKKRRTSKKNKKTLIKKTRRR